MARTPAENVIIRKPSNDVYTVLTIIATLACIAALVVVWKVGTDVFGGSGVF